MKRLSFYRITCAMKWRWSKQELRKRPRPPDILPGDDTARLIPGLLREKHFFPFVKTLHSALHGRLLVFSQATQQHVLFPSPDHSTGLQQIENQPRITAFSIDFQF